MRTTLVPSTCVLCAVPAARVEAFKEAKYVLTEKMARAYLRTVDKSRSTLGLCGYWGSQAPMPQFR